MRRSSEKHITAYCYSVAELPDRIQAIPSPSPSSFSSREWSSADLAFRQSVVVEESALWTRNRRLVLFLPIPIRDRFDLHRSLFSRFRAPPRPLRNVPFVLHFLHPISSSSSTVLSSIPSEQSSSSKPFFSNPLLPIRTRSSLANVDILQVVKVDISILFHFVDFESIVSYDREFFDRLTTFQFLKVEEDSLRDRSDTSSFFNLPAVRSYRSV